MLGLLDSISTTRGWETPSFLASAARVILASALSLRIARTRLILRSITRIVGSSRLKNSASVVA